MLWSQMNTSLYLYPHAPFFPSPIQDAHTHTHPPTHARTDRHTIHHTPAHPHTHPAATHTRKHTHLLNVVLPCPSEGARVITTEDKDGVVIRVGVRGVEHGHQLVLLPLTCDLSNIQQHAGSAICLRGDEGAWQRGRWDSRK